MHDGILASEARERLYEIKDIIIYKDRAISSGRLESGLCPVGGRHLVRKLWQGHTVTRTKDRTVVKKAIANGTRIKQLRNDSLYELPQKTFAARCRVSERHLRRIENENQLVPMPLLHRIAKELTVSVEEIAFSTRGPRLVGNDERSVAPTSAVTSESEIIPRHTTIGLLPISTAQSLYELAEGSMEIIPHILVDVPSLIMAMIKECLSLLKATSDRRWSCGAPVKPDVYDDSDFPEINRRTRLAELFVLIKGHDVRIVAERETYLYPAGAQPWLKGQDSCFHLVLGFAPPRGEYEDESVSVPFDQGREIILPSELPF